MEPNADPNAQLRTTVKVLKSALQKYNAVKRQQQERKEQQESTVRIDEQLSNL